MEKSKRDKPNKSFITDDSGLTLTYLQGQIWSLRCLNVKNVKQYIYPKQL